MSVYDQKSYESLVQAGTASATARAHFRDVRYFKAWARLALGQHRGDPLTREVVIAFILQHNGTMPIEVEDALVCQGLRRKRGTLSMRSTSRILGSISAVHDLAGISNPVRDPQVKILMKKARHARAGESPKQKAAITQPILEAMLKTCEDSLRGIRDRAILLTGFTTGGRRRSELAAFRIEDLEFIQNGYILNIRKSKTDQEGKGATVPVLGTAAKAVEYWLQISGIQSGFLFRGIHRSGTLYPSISGETIHRIVKRRIQLVGLDPQLFGAHSLRSGFMTSAARAGIPLAETMRLSQHRSPTVATLYYRQSDILENPAARLLETQTDRPLYGLRDALLPC